jgi:ADP-ribosylglycohydrolase
VHDPLSLPDLVQDELRQRRETGFEVSEVAEALATTPPDDEPALERLYAALAGARRGRGWPYDEPDLWDEVLAACAPTPALDAPRELPADLDDRILGGWLGRIVGCNLGKPFETGDWTPSRIRHYLGLAGAHPLRDYVPVLDPMPDGCRLHPDWPVTTRGRVRGSARDDDIDYTILGLHVLERHGPALQSRDVAAAWLAYLPYLRVFTAERAVYRNLLRGVPSSRAADVRNPYREWIGALIRGDVFGWVLPGDPVGAARLAYADASLSHRGNGLYGGLWSAALLSCAMVARCVADAFTSAMALVPARSRLAEVLRDVHRLYAAGRSWEQAIGHVRERWGDLSWVHTVNNAGVIAAGLLWGEDDFAATVGLTVEGGWDTDSNAATAGSVAGTVMGAARLPAYLVEPLQDRTRSAVFGYDHSWISDLAGRTCALARTWPR